MIEQPWCHEGEGSTAREEGVGVEKIKETQTGGGDGREERWVGTQGWGLKLITGDLAWGPREREGVTLNRRMTGDPKVPSDSPLGALNLNPTSPSIERVMLLKRLWASESSAVIQAVNCLLVGWCWLYQIIYKSTSASTVQALNNSPQRSKHYHIWSENFK